MKDGHRLKQRILEPEHDPQRVEDEGLIGRGVRLTAMGPKGQSNRIFDTAAAHAQIVRTVEPDLSLGTARSVEPCLKAE